MAGAVIRAVGHPGRGRSRHPLSAAALAPGGDRHHRDRQDHAAAPAVGRVHGHGAAAGTRQGRAGGRCWWCWTARAGPTRGGSPTGPGGCCAWPGPGPPPIWPDEASLSLWALPPGQLTTTLVDLIEHGTGGAAYYADVMEAVVALAVEAPGGPPASAADFLARLDPGWLAPPTRPAGTRPSAALIRSAARQVGDIALRFRTLLRRLGGGLDGPGGFGDADAWYCILEGTAEIAWPRRRPARWSTCWPATPPRPRQPGREILLAVDEFSAVSRRLPIWQLYERARSLGLAVQVSAQSWQGLAAEDDERYRIAATADGGIWLLRTPHPEPVAALAGSRKAPTPRGACSACPGLGPRGHVAGAARPGRRPGPDPRARRRPGRLHLPRRRHLRSGQTARRGTSRTGRPGAGRTCAGPGRRSSGPRGSCRQAGRPGRAPLPPNAAVPAGDPPRVRRTRRRSPLSWTRRSARSQAEPIRFQAGPARRFGLAHASLLRRLRSSSVKGIETYRNEVVRGEAGMRYLREPILPPTSGRDCRNAWTLTPKERESQGRLPVTASHRVLRMGPAQ